MFISSLWDVKEPTHYSRRVGDEFPGVVAVLCEHMVWVGVAGPHQLNSCQYFNLLKQINNITGHVCLNRTHVMIAWTSQVARPVVIPNRLPIFTQGSLQNLFVGNDAKMIVEFDI